MMINDLDALDKLLLLCHRRNVHTIIVDGITIQLTPQDPDLLKTQPAPEVFIDPHSGLPMSDEEILFWGTQARS